VYGVACYIRVVGIGVVRVEGGKTDLDFVSYLGFYLLLTMILYKVVVRW
jgi:hypothetical protein